MPSLIIHLIISDLSLVSPKIRSAYGEGTVVYNSHPGLQKFVSYMYILLP